MWRRVRFGQESARCKRRAAGSRLVRAPHVHAAPSFGRYAVAGHGLRVLLCEILVAAPLHTELVMVLGSSSREAITGSTPAPHKTRVQRCYQDFSTKGYRGNSSSRSCSLGAPPPNELSSCTEFLCKALSVITLRSIIRGRAQVKRRVHNASVFSRALSSEEIRAR